MTVVPFTPGTARSPRSWDADELERLVGIFAVHASNGDASAWDVGATELEDPQFYILGPAPDYDCIVAISRVGRTYVLENGSGQVVAEDRSLDTIAARAERVVGQRKRASLTARVVLAVGALRLAVEEKLEPLYLESEELLLRVVPQLAALA